MQERPQGIIHMKIATICLLKPAPSNSSANCSRALGTSDSRFETPGLGSRGQSSAPAQQRSPCLGRTVGFQGIGRWVAPSTVRRSMDKATAGSGPISRAYLAPHQHCPEHNLEPVEEVVSDDDHGRAPRGPAFTGTDGLDARSGCPHKTENGTLEAAPTPPRCPPPATPDTVGDGRAAAPPGGTQRAIVDQRVDAFKANP